MTSNANVMRGNSENSKDKTNLIFHHGVADILDHVAKLVHILGTLQGPRNRASL